MEGRDESQIWNGQRVQRCTAAAAEAHCLIASAGKVSDGGVSMKRKRKRGEGCAGPTPQQRQLSEMHHEKTHGGQVGTKVCGTTTQLKALRA